MSLFALQTDEEVSIVLLCDSAIDWAKLKVDPEWAVPDIKELRDALSDEERKRAEKWEKFYESYLAHPSPAKLKFKKGYKPDRCILRPPPAKLYGRIAAEMADDASKDGDTFTVAMVDMQENWYKRISLSLIRFEGTNVPAIEHEDWCGRPRATDESLMDVSPKVAKELADHVDRLSEVGEELAKN